MGWLGFGTCALPHAARGTELGRAGGVMGQRGVRCSIMSCFDNCIFQCAWGVFFHTIAWGRQEPTLLSGGLFWAQGSVGAGVADDYM